jgi:hypothetical protein
MGRKDVPGTFFTETRLHPKLTHFALPNSVFKYSFADFQVQILFSNIHLLTFKHTLCETLCKKEIQKR